jgi:hypothetical protein
VNSFGISKRQLFGISVSIFLLVLILAINLVLRLNTVSSLTDYKMIAQYIQTVGKTFLIFSGFLLGLLILGGTAALIAGRKTIAMQLYTGVLFATVVALSAAWSFTPRAYTVLPSVFLATTVVFHFLKMNKIRQEFLLMLIVSVVTTFVLKMYILFG